MTLTATPWGAPTNTPITKETALSTTLVKNVRGEPTTLKSFRTDKSAGGSNQVSVKLFDSAGEDVTLGTTGPDIIWPVDASEVLELEIDGGLQFVNGLSMVAAEEDGKVVTTVPDVSTRVDLMTRG